jgi:hypothetical protein
MCMKKVLVCLVVLLTASVMTAPCYCGVTATLRPIAHSWPNIAGSVPYVKTYSDPNTPGSSTGDFVKVQEDLNDRAVCQTFTIPADSNGLTMTSIVITVNGAGAGTNLPMSLHVFDMNQLMFHAQDSSYNLWYSSMPRGYDFLNSATFVYPQITGANDVFIEFDFNTNSTIDLEPNHIYTFEIWPTKGNDPGWSWLRDMEENPYPGGRAYRTAPPNTYMDLSVDRNAIGGGIRAMVMGVYGIPCDGNAFHPMPQDYSTDVPLSTTLRWHAGRWAGPGSHSGHMLYFSSVETAVRNRGTAARVGKLTDANFTDPYNPSYTPTNLLPDKWYYWRVDEYNDLNNPMPPHHSRPTDTDANYWGRGDYGYWRFKTQSVFAQNPVPANNTEAELILNSAWLGWTKGCYAADVNGHQVYFGTNYNDVSNATTATAVIYRGAVTDPCYLLNKLAPDYTLTSGTTYYWRIDEVNSTVSPYLWKGSTWSFTATIIDLNKASNPNPSNGAIHVFPSSVLSWDAPVAFTPTSYDVYLGTNPDAHSNPVTTVYTNSYDPPGDLARGTTYYWAIDSNDAGTIYASEDWSFTTLYASTNIVTNPSFESGTYGWTARGGCSISSLTSPVPHAGSYCASAYGRTATWHGIQQDVMNKMVIGATYTVSAWLRTSTSASSNVDITFQQTDNAGTDYFGAGSGTASNSGWVQISGSFTLDVTGTLTGLLVCFEGPDSGIDLYVDDIVVYGPSVVPIDPNKATNPTPNNGLNEIPISTGLSWNAPAGFTPVSYEVYLGTDANAHNNPHHTVYTNSYDPPGYLIGGRIYYWAIDSNDSGTIYAGDDWHFTTNLANVRWRVGAKCFSNGPPGSFDANAVKDPSIVYSGGKWHLFYSAVSNGNFQLGYACAETIKGLSSATHTYLSSLSGCAPQVFWFEPQGKWYLIYQYGAKYSTNTDINNPNGWTAATPLFSDGVVDYWCISDGNNVYCFYSPQDGSHVIKRRSTTVADFPSNWSAASNVCSDTFEAPHVYKNIPDGKYYMMVEDISRHQELWTATTLGGSWTKITENWAGKSNFVYKADHWTDQASHGEIIRAGVDEKMEISDIDNCEILIQGVTDANYNVDYSSVPYDLGLIRLCPSSDLNHDCDVDFPDFAALGSQWRQPPSDPNTDIAPLGGDGIVDMNDLALFADYWLWRQWEY